jgi:malate dehydrogenase (oxaloacetate-decarboxylating)(NADP+)
MTSKSEVLMGRIRSGAKAHCPRIVFAEGENPRVIDACRIVVEEGAGRPILLGRKETIEHVAQRMGLSMDACQTVDPMDSPDSDQLLKELINVGARGGITAPKASLLITDPIYYGMMMLRVGQADAMIVGANDAYGNTMRTLLPMTEPAPTVHRAAGFQVLLIEGQVFVMGDTTLNIDPTPECLAEIALLGAEFAKELGLVPKVALLSFSDFGSSNHAKAKKVRRAVEILHKDYPELICDGEMHGDVAVVPGLAKRNFPFSQIQGDANVLICPDLDSAFIAYKLLMATNSRSEFIGPVLKGLRQPVNMVSYDSTARDIANLAAFSAYGAVPTGERIGGVVTHR